MTLNSKDRLTLKFTAVASIANVIVIGAAPVGSGSHLILKVADTYIKHALADMLFTYAFFQFLVIYAGSHSYKCSQVLLINSSGSMLSSDVEPSWITLAEPCLW